MRSRYDLCRKSNVTSPDGTKYKDMFTVPFQKFKYNDIVIEHTLTSSDLKRPDSLIHKYYRASELDDIVNFINVIGLLQNKSVGDIIQIPSLSDMEKFYYQYRE